MSSIYTVSVTPSGQFVVVDKFDGVQLTLAVQSARNLGRALTAAANHIESIKPQFTPIGID